MNWISLLEQDLIVVMATRVLSLKKKDNLCLNFLCVLYNWKSPSQPIYGTTT